MAGTFLLTFDAEGKWGWVDCLSPRLDCYTSRALEGGYRDLLALLHRYRVRSTFAFTAAFTLGAAEFARLRPEVERSALGRTPWMQQAFAAIEGQQGDGWLVPACVAAVQHAGGHEIGSHGFSHIPWGEPYATREVLDAELKLNRGVPGFGRRDVSSFIYPRNEVAHTDLLTEYGFASYRAQRPSLGRLGNFLREFDVIERSEAAVPAHARPVPLPAGQFLNWRIGLRRHVPAAVTVRRWRHMIRHAARTGGVVHAWSHPENFVDGEGMFPMLEQILQTVAEEREAGRLRVVTCRALAQRSVPVPELVAQRGRNARRA